MASQTNPRFHVLNLPSKWFSARKATTRLVIHSLDTPPDWREDIREIDRWHREERGWKCIGYHYVIWRNGAITMGRPLWAIGAHVQGWNSTSVAIALSGGKGSRRTDYFLDNYTEDQDDGLTLLVNALQLRYADPPLELCGHHEHPTAGKECPGFNVKDWYHGRERR